ncbi:MAG: class II aldolase/adducin family protein [Chloroflexota bacterium]|nr:class II aldolase/adducin family protein [Chloroflexota bacterium]
MLLGEQRERVVRVGLEALARGVVHGTSGNMSLRDPESGLIAISPSGMPYPSLTPADVVVVDAAGAVVDGARKPSSETPLHTMLLRERPGIDAVVHTHSHYATVVGCIRSSLPPILTEVALVVGARVPVTRYGLTGTPDFGESVLEALAEVGDSGRAAILKNHGLVCLGRDLDEALGLAEVVEESAKVYVHALAANGGREPDLVPEELIPGMRARFLATYGQG